MLPGLPDPPAPERQQGLAPDAMQLLHEALSAREGDPVPQAAAWFLEANASDGPLAAGLRYAAITTVLAEDHGEPARDTRAPGELERALRPHLLALRDEMAHLTAGVGSAEAPPVQDGMLAWDALFARHIAPLGRRGKALARQVTQVAGQRFEQHRLGRLPVAELFRIWLPPAGTPAARYVTALAKVLWLEQVRPRLSPNQDKPPALVLPVMRVITQLHSRALEHDETGATMLRFDDGGSARIKPPPTLDAGVLNNMVRRGLDLLGSLTAHRVLRWEIWEGHGRVLRGDPDPRLLTVDGGWSELAELLGVGAKKRDEVHAIMIAQSRYEFQLPDGSYGDLVSLNVLPARGQRRGRLSITLGVALLPDYVHELRSRLGSRPRLAREAQRLVPIVDLPPFVGRPNEHGQQATLSMSVVTEMRLRARELVAEGGISLVPDRLGALATQAGVPTSLIDSLIDRWTHDGDDGPAFLKPTGDKRVTLGDAHATARAFLEEAGRREHTASEAGQQSVRRRRRALSPGS
jgi:hypothetical protein